MKEHAERNKRLNRAVFNDWGLYGFVQMLVYKSLLYGKEFAKSKLRAEQGCNQTKSHAHPLLGVE